MITVLDMEIGASVFNEWKWVVTFPYFKLYPAYKQIFKSKLSSSDLNHYQSLIHVFPSSFITTNNFLLTGSLKSNDCFAVEILPLFNSPPYLTPYSLTLTLHIFTSLAIQNH